MKVSKKFDDFINYPSKIDFLEGVTSAGKTTVGIFKFMLDVAESPHKQHIISGLDGGTIEKNIINKPHGILDEFGPLVEYKGSGSSGERMAHLKFYTSKGIKKIYILGYADKARWKKALGAQYGCLYVDEINIADMDFVREAFMRCEKVIATLNPDDPNLPIYEEYINHSAPLDKYNQDEPPEILKELKGDKEGWIHWFFNFSDNIALTKEKIETIKSNVPKGTKLYRNKIEGIRCRATGLIFSNFNDNHIVKLDEAKKQNYKRLVLGIDTAYSQKSPDTIAMELIGITEDKKLYVLEERIYNNAKRQVPLAPSDVVREIVDFADFCRVRWGNFRDIFIDSADQATLTETSKYKREFGSIYNFVPSYKKMKILDRINLQLGWLATNCFYIVEHCKEYVHELETYSWTEDGKPEDGNDHTINAVQYGFLPYVGEIGI